MKTLMLRVCYLGVAVTTILASPGTEEPATTDAIDPVADVLAPLQIVDADALADADLPAPLAAPGDTNAPIKLPFQEPTPPPNVKLSPALAEVVKLIHAGVSPDVLMAYVTNSTAVFNIDSDTIVYLNDLGVTNTVITALIQHDASPHTAARKAAVAAAQPLPPGVAATAPVTDVYPPAARSTLPAVGETTYPGDFSTVTDPNAEVVADLQPAVSTAPPANENVTVNHFYSSLAPYGSWVDVDGYGLCWRPTVAVSDPYWRPYGDRGRWLWSDSGWYWYSDYSWGWAPFHYGRWCSYPRLGWIWVPGSVWAPSWVTWRYTDSYCGWAPLPPGCGFRSGIGLTWYGRGVSIGFDFGLSSHCWSYVPTSRFCDWNVRRHCLPENRLHVVHKTAVHANRISIRNKGIVNDGIEPNSIARASRTKIPTMKIKDGVLPANRGVKPERIENRGNEITVVRPKLPKTAPAAITPVASRGNGTRGNPVTVGNSGQAAARPNAAAPREVARNNPAASGVVRDQGAAKRHDTVTLTPQNPAVRPAPANRPQARPQTTTPNVQRQTPAAPVQRQTPAQAPRNNVAARPAPAPATPSQAPAVRNPSPVARNFAPARNQTARPAPAQRNVSPLIRSYAQPQRSTPHPLAPRVAPPSVRATPAPAARPQFSAPQASRPSVSAPRSAPSINRSAPSTGRGGGGGGGNRGGGGGGNGNGNGGARGR